MALNNWFYLLKKKNSINQLLKETEKFCQQITNFATILYNLFKDNLIGR